MTDDQTADRLSQITARAKAVDKGPLGRKCPSCGSGPGVACYGNGPMRQPHAPRFPSIETDDIPWLLALIAQQAATIHAVQDLRSSWAQEDPAKWGRNHYDVEQAIEAMKYCLLLELDRTLDAGQTDGEGS
jgi:hypothetical protein